MSPCSNNASVSAEGSSGRSIIALLFLSAVDGAYPAQVCSRHLGFAQGNASRKLLLPLVGSCVMVPANFPTHWSSVRT